MQDLIEKYRKLRHQYSEYQESASWYAYNAVVIILESSRDTGEAYILVGEQYGNSANQDSATILMEAWEDIIMQELLEDFEEARDNLMEELSHGPYETKEETQMLDALKLICIVLATSPSVSRATDEMAIEFGMASNRSARNIIGQAWGDLRALERTLWNQKKS